MHNPIDLQEGGLHEGISPQELAHLGDGELAYVKAVRSDDIADLFPEAPTIQPGLDLFALVNADGRPIMLTDSRESALANAVQNELTTLSLH